YAYCGNDPVNRHDPLGLAELDPSAPSSDAIKSQIEILGETMGLLQAMALERNASDCIGWRPSQFVNSGATGRALGAPQDFLSSVLKVRDRLGSNGYGEWSTDSAIRREFGDYGEDVRAFFVPKGGYTASANTRMNLDLGMQAAGISLDATLALLPLPFPKGTSLVSRGGRAVLDDAAASRSLVLHRDQLIINNYQRYYNDAWLKVTERFNKGRIQIPVGQHWKTVLGQLTDKAARDRLRNFLAREGIAEGPKADVLVNRWLRDPLGSGAYRIPDVRLLQTRKILDGTIGTKTLSMPQPRDFIQFSGGDEVIFVTPTVGPGF
ncbi:MAG: hypothetical protein WCK25_06660, partial [Actinomycetes bacterium]